MRPVVELAGVRAGYGRVEVLRDLDLVVPEGALVSLVGFFFVTMLFEPLFLRS